MYAILSHGGRQYRVSAGDRLLVDRLDAEVGSVVALEPVLLTGGDGKTALGKDLDGLRVAVTVVAHRRGEKLRIFKYKAKKRSRKVAGYRSDLTELRVESILAKGAALPKATATNGAPKADRRAAAERPAPAPRASRTAAPEAQTRTTPAKPSTAKAAASAKPATPAARPAASTAKRASAGRAKPSTGTAQVTDDSATAASSSGATATAKPKTTSGAAKAKAAPKRASKGSTASKEKEKGDGA